MIEVEQNGKPIKTLGAPSRRSCDACESLGARIRKIIKFSTCRRRTTSHTNQGCWWKQTFTKVYVEQAFSRICVSVSPSADTLACRRTASADVCLTLSRGSGVGHVPAVCYGLPQALHFGACASSKSFRASASFPRSVPSLCLHHCLTSASERTGCGPLRPTGGPSRPELSCMNDDVS